MKQLKVLNLPQIEAQLCCSGIADVVNVDRFPQVIPGYYIVCCSDVPSPMDLTAKQFQEYQNHILFGNIVPISQQTCGVIGVVYVSEVSNGTDSIWCNTSFPYHLRVEKSFRFINPYLVDNLFNFDSTNLIGLVKESKQMPQIENGTLFVPLCEDVFIYIQEGESIYISVTPLVAQIVTSLYVAVEKITRVTFVCGKYNRTFILGEIGTQIQPDSATSTTEAGKDESKFPELKITLGSEISPL